MNMLTCMYYYYYYIYIYIIYIIIHPISLTVLDCIANSGRNLQQLYLRKNSISDISELYHLQPLTNLKVYTVLASIVSCTYNSYTCSAGVLCVSIMERFLEFLILFLYTAFF